MRIVGFDAVTVVDDDKVAPAAALPACPCYCAAVCRGNPRTRFCRKVNALVHTAAAHTVVRGNDSSSYGTGELAGCHGLRASLRADVNNLCYGLCNNSTADDFSACFLIIYIGDIGNNLSRTDTPICNNLLRTLVNRAVFNGFCFKRDAFRILNATDSLNREEGNLFGNGELSACTETTRAD